MYFRRFYDEQLAQASYLIGCQRTGEAIVLDPSRLVDQYLEVARAQGLRITAVTETHIHADFLSGLRELAAKTGARMYLSGCGPPDWQYGYRTDPLVTLLDDRARIRIGNVELEAVHTPGHTPEHLVFLVTDGATATDPIGVVTGDFVFVGDVGRPDLLEKAARIDNTAEAGARTLFHSLSWFKTLPDHLQIWPGHGAGSACGKGLGAMPQSTVGYERRYNWAFGVTDEAQFISQVLEGQPEPPRYFGRMKQLNRDGPPVLGRLPEPPELAPAQLPDLLERGAVVVDTRSISRFAHGFVPETINLPMGRSFSTYAGSLLPYDRDLYFILREASPEAVRALVEALVTIGLDRVAGWLGPTAVDAWRDAGQPLGTIGQASPAEVATATARPFLLDVRTSSEWSGGHLPGATLIPLPELLARIDEVPKSGEVVVNCQSGERSSIVASVLKARGWRRVSSLAGGFSAWVAAGKAVSRS